MQWLIMPGQDNENWSNVILQLSLDLVFSSYFYLKTEKDVAKHRQKNYLCIFYHFSQ